jgi:predicted MFS family arabinose efflux permease
VQLGLTLGLIVSPAFGAWLTPALGWRSAFLLIAALGTGAGLTLWRWLPLARGAAPGAAPGCRRGWRELLATPGAAAAVATMTLGLGVAVGTYALVGEFLRERYALGTATIGGVMALFGLFTVAGNALVGSAFRRFGTPPRVILVGIAGAGAGIGFIAFAPALPLAGFLLAGAVWLVAGGCAAPALQSYLATVGGADRGMLLALGSSGLSLGIALMTALEGWLYAAHGRRAVGAVALGAIAVAVLWLARHAGSPAAAGGEAA